MILTFSSLCGAHKQSSFSVLFFAYTAIRDSLILSLALGSRALSPRVAARLPLMCSSVTRTRHSHISKRDPEMLTSSQSMMMSSWPDISHGATNTTAKSFSNPAQDTVYFHFDFYDGKNGQISDIEVK